jgi:hypothetical protein
MGDVNTPAPYPVNGKGCVPIPALQKESSFLFAALSLQSGQPSGQFVTITNNPAGFSERT